jgi:hypothetical protein
VQAESYVVRIYRRGHAKRQSIIGVVEAVNSGWQKPFQSFEELAEILARPRGRSKPRALRDIEVSFDSSGQGRKR